MNLSNKILLGFFACVFLYLTAAFAELRLTGSPIVIDESNSMAEIVEMPGMRSIILKGLKKHILVVGSDHPRLEVRSFSGDMLQRLKYTFSGDTLTLSELQVEDVRTVKITIFLPETGLKAITVDKANAELSGLEQEHLLVSQQAGRMWMSDNRIGKLHLSSFGKSYLEVSETKLDTLSVDSHESEIIVSSPVTVLEGSINNASRLRLIDIGKAEFEKDSSSTFLLYE